MQVTKPALETDKKNEAGPTGVEPATLGLKVRCSSLTELRTRTHFWCSCQENAKGFFSVSDKKKQKAKKGHKTTRFHQY